MQRGKLMIEQENRYNHLTCGVAQLLYVYKALTALTVTKWDEAQAKHDVTSEGTRKCYGISRQSAWRRLHTFRFVSADIWV